MITPVQPLTLLVIAIAGWLQRDQQWFGFFAHRDVGMAVDPPSADALDVTVEGSAVVDPIGDAEKLCETTSS